MKVLALICLVAAIGYVQAFQSCQSTNQPDVVLVVEDSDKLPAADVDQLQQFVAEIVSTFNLDEGLSRVAYQQYSDQQISVFNLIKFDQTNDAKSTVLKTPFARTLDTSPIIADALNYTWTNELTVTNGERSCHPQVIILISYSSYNDPNSHVNAIDPTLKAKDLTAVRQLKNSGSLVITVGVGQYRNPVHLLELASGPEFYHDFATFGDLTLDSADAIALQACLFTPTGNFYPCEMNATQADIVFVVDTSPNFAADATLRTAVVSFMRNLLSAYNFDHVTGVQAAFVTYQTDADVKINFNGSYDGNLGLNKFLNDVDAALGSPCSTCTGRCVDEALDKIINHVFVAGGSPVNYYRQTCTIHQIYIFTSDCFNCDDPKPLADTLRTDARFPNTEIFVIPLKYGYPSEIKPQTFSPGFWKEYLDIAYDASHLWEAFPDPTPIVTEYLHKQAWRAVCRQFGPVRCAPAPPASTSMSTALSTASTSSGTSQAFAEEAMAQRHPRLAPRQ